MQMCMISLAQEFQSVVVGQRMQLPYLPAAGSEVVWLRSGYAAHLQRQRPPQDPAPVPKDWAAAEKCRVDEVCPYADHADSMYLRYDCISTS